MSAGPSATEPTLARRALRLALATSVFVAAGYFGRTTVIDGKGLSLIWPAVGVAGLWIGSGNRRTWPTDLIALSLSIVVVTMTTGATLASATVFLATNLIQVLTFVAMTRRWIPQIWGLGGTEPLRRSQDLGRLIIAACLSGVASISIGVVGAALELHRLIDVPTLTVWWGRNTIALIVISVFGILAGQPLATAGGAGPAFRRLLDGLRPASAGRAVETVGLLGLSVALALLIFGDVTAQPLAFLLLVMSVWAGLRYSPIGVVIHGVVMGTCGVAFTLAGQGPFAAVASIHYRALVAQGFVAMTVLTGLALAFSRLERDTANRQLAEARRAADERAELLDAVLESMNEGIFVIEEGGRVLVRNTAGRKLVGVDEDQPHELQPAAAYGLFHSNGVQVTDAELPANRALAGEVVAPVDLHVRTPSVPLGRVVEISAHPLENHDPAAPHRAMVNIRDVTLDRQHRDTLSSFAGVVAHDLFNPLSVVDGWTEALADEFEGGPVSPMVGHAMVTRIHDAAAHMRVFIADLMSYTIAGDASIRPGPVDLTGMVRSLAGLRTAANSAPLIVVADDLEVWADAGLVRQLLDNLLGNAIKYVAPGTRPIVEVTGNPVDDWLEVHVADNGIGIPEEQREAIFENFHRAHGSNFVGTGLGLAICRRIVERHGGTIHVAPATHGAGSEFVFRLPLLATPAQTPGRPDQVPVDA
ncbi:MAG: sensor signal transduction histidine kinase [Marmoricola sp.]|nr:sensor signal transduction histidine kinase [Marmoricola sp.]